MDLKHIKRVLHPADIQAINLSIMKVSPILRAVLMRLITKDRPELGDVVKTLISRKHPKGSYGVMVEYNDGVEGGHAPNCCVKFSDTGYSTENYNYDEVELICKKEDIQEL